MKKLIAVGVVLTVALALVLSFTLPASATTLGTGTGVTVTEGSSAQPLIKAKWEQLKGYANLEDGDPTHIIGPCADTSCPPCGTKGPCGAQFLASGQFEVDKTIEYYVMVQDDDGPGDIANVYVRVYHPRAGEDCAPADGSEKYELRLTEIPKGLIYDGEGNVTGYEPGKGVDKFLKAMEAGLVTFNSSVVANSCSPTQAELDEIMWELDKCDARIYRAEGPLHYHQPCGKYTVKAKAVDKGGTWAAPLFNCFEYICLQAFRIDFDSVQFGNVNLCTTKWIWGDTTFDDPVGAAPAPNKATVHNVGNMPMQLKIAQTDMGLGFTGLAPTAISTADENVIKRDTTWNVYFDARLGGNPAHEMFFDPYDPDVTPEPVFTTLPTVLLPCNPQELDLSIHIIKADAVTHSGTMTLECVEANWPCGTVPGTEPWPWTTPWPPPW
jgi:hypothetical protein